MAVDRVTEFLHIREVCVELSESIRDSGFSIISDFGEGTKRIWRESWFQPVEGAPMGGEIELREASRSYDCVEVSGLLQDRAGRTLHYLISSTGRRSDFDVYLTPEPIDKNKFPIEAAPVLKVEVDSDSLKVEKLKVFGREVNLSEGEFFDFDNALANDLQGFIAFFDAVRREKGSAVELPQSN